MSSIMAEIETVFPKLSGTSYKKTSDDTERYNCLAWAAGDDDRWWESGHPFDVGYYWPRDTPEGAVVSSLTAAYQSIGYRLCGDGKLEEGFEKIAVYGASSGEWTHAARRLSSGAWTSKLGVCEDIEHEQPDHLECPTYGSVHCYMKRQKE